MDFEACSSSDSEFNAGVSHSDGSRADSLIVDPQFDPASTIEGMGGRTWVEQFVGEDTVMAKTLLGAAHAGSTTCPIEMQQRMSVLIFKGVMEAQKNWIPVTF